MAQEADFYSVEEAAKVLGIPVTRVFGMLCGGELEGYQDDWARWRVPASAIRPPGQQPASTPDHPGAGDSSEPRAVEDGPGLGDAPTVVNDSGPLLSPTGGARPSSDEETTQEVGEAPVGGGARSSASMRGDAEATQVLPGVESPEIEVPVTDSNDTTRALARRLAAAAARSQELRERLKVAESTEAALRDRLERARRRADREGAGAVLQS